MELIKETPNLEEFDPNPIKWQKRAICDIRNEMPKIDGRHEILLSGAVGSAKSIFMAHVAITHCLFYPGARVCLGRRDLQSLKDTLFKDCVDHLTGTKLVRDVHWSHTDTPARINFCNGSQIICRSWADKKWIKIRSLRLSMVCIEELTENIDDLFYRELRNRVGRLPGIPENLIVCATNPGSPSHWAYNYFVRGALKSQTKHVYYSVTKDNPFLPDWYLKQAQEDYSPLEARRMLDGEWLDIDKEVIYYEYKEDRNHRDSDYELCDHRPIDITFDFNIGSGKPMSAAVGQFQTELDRDPGYHVFGESVVHGARTKDILDELAAQGVFEHSNPIRIYGDATGKNKDTRSITSDYDIIEKFIANYQRKDGGKVQFEMNVPKKNPPIRERHNIVNARCCNSLGQVRFYTYRTASTANEGMRLTKLKKGADYLEDDSKPYQHITTAIGYWIVYNHNELKRGRTRTVEL